MLVQVQIQVQVQRQTQEWGKRPVGDHHLHHNHHNCHEEHKTIKSFCSGVCGEVSWEEGGEGTLGDQAHQEAC